MTYTELIDELRKEAEEQGFFISFNFHWSTGLRYVIIAIDNEVPMKLKLTRIIAPIFLARSGDMLGFIRHCVKDSIRKMVEAVNAGKGNEHEKN